MRLVLAELKGRKRAQRSVCVCGGGEGVVCRWTDEVATVGGGVNTWVGVNL